MLVLWLEQGDKILNKWFNHSCPLLFNLKIWLKNRNLFLKITKHVLEDSYESFRNSQFENRNDLL